MVKSIKFDEAAYKAALLATDHSGSVWSAVTMAILTLAIAIKDLRDDAQP